MANEKRLLCKKCDHYLVCKYADNETEECSQYKAPTVDAVEVVHGRWIFKHNPITDPKKYFIRIVCSKCNLHTGQTSNYCPNCGAKMDGGNEDG